MKRDAETRKSEVGRKKARKEEIEHSKQESFPTTFRGV
jgi:hypothetical protein